MTATQERFFQERHKLLTRMEARLGTNLLLKYLLFPKNVEMVNNLSRMNALTPSGD